MPVSALIAAGGRGRRVGGLVPKQLLAIDGRAVLERSVALFLDHPAVDEIVVALPYDVAADPPPYLIGTPKPLRVVAGGERRQDSVLNAFEAADAASDVIVIHDAARPFASADLISRTIAAAADAGAALAALPASDTVKRGQQDLEGGGFVVSETLARETIFLAQTPQAFRREVLRAALAFSQTGVDVTDEAMLAERAGYTVRLVPGEVTNIKITNPEDVSVAERIARSTGSGPARSGRAGTGYDLHRLVPGRRLVIGGVLIPFERGALGHSDADVVCHAVTDAVLGAVGLGDIGQHFPDSDPRWKDASSIDLLAQVAALIAEHGYEVGNVDVTVILEAPKVKGYIEPMCANVARALGVARERVSIKGKTNEGVDAVGRGEAIAAHAVALLRVRPDETRAAGTPGHRR
jgi:2-C-methyl-D-erythritol 4-phosphate cytidylyltransferase/2-C-methyl-D-erythritol 2,4-cyclodiphosphate synthase